jgi:acetyl esterase/lipase
MKQLSQMIAVLSMFVYAFPVHSDEAKPYTQLEDVVFKESHGMGLVMDIFTPPGKGNGRGLIVAASGAWSSDRGKISDLGKGGVFDVFCGRGYHVFAIRPGSISRFSAADMTRHLEEGIKWVKGKAGQYGIDPEKLCLLGASAGGHLASLVALTTERQDPKTDATVAATGVFFPPTDFLDYGGQKLDPRKEDRMSQILARLAYGNREAVAELDDDEIHKATVAVSPARLVTKEAPPFLIIHGDADKAVPLQQSQALLKALEEKGADAKLIIKEGGGHPWPTIREEVAVMADWFDENT